MPSPFKPGILIFLALIHLGASASNTATANETTEQLLTMTDGKQVKVVWAQNDKIRYFDTSEGRIEELPFPEASQPLFTTDGLKVLCSAGGHDDRKVLMYDTETRKLTTLSTGKYSGLLTVWRDPETGRDWVYVNDAGSDDRNWDQPLGDMYRFPIDNPDEKELFWDRTTTHLYFMLSADGKRACFEPNWSNIGQLNLEYDADGRVDQEKSVYRPIGGGCFPGLSPDNSYRMFRLDGGHKVIHMTDADGENPRTIDVTGMPGVGDAGRQVWLTRWSTHPRYLTLMGPDGDDARIWIGRFDQDFTRIEEWVRVVDEGPKCWQSHAWIEQDDTAPAGAGASADIGAAVDSAWPAVGGAVFALRDGSVTSPVVAFDDRGRAAMGFSLGNRGRSLIGRYHELVCAGGSFLTPGVGAWIGREVAQSGVFTIEATLTPAPTPREETAVVMTYANEDGEDFSLLHDASGLALRLPGNPPIPLFKPEPGRPVHLVLLGSKDRWLVYRNGVRAGAGTLENPPPAWGERELVIGAGWDGANPWLGRIEGIAVFPHALPPDQATAQAAAIRASLAGRQAAPSVRFRGTLTRQAETSTLEEIRPYTRSLTVAEYKVDEVLEGHWDEPVITVLHWMIMDAERLPIADRTPGASVELTVEPFDSQPQLQTIRRDELIDGDFTAVLFYCESENAP